MQKGTSTLGMLVSLAAIALSERPVMAAKPDELRSPPQVSTKPDAQSSAQFALSLISSGVEAARDCDPASQAIVLLMAGGAVRTLDPAKALTYYAGSFEAVQSLAGSHLRLTLQRMLVAQITDVDVDQAVQLVTRMDTPEITAKPDVDSRVGTAHTVIKKLLARGARDDPDKAVELLEFLGDTGQYPYAAAGEAITFFHRKGEDDRALDVFMRAMGYARQDNQFKTTANEFLDLIKSSEGKIAQSVLVSAFRLLTARVKEAVTSQGTTNAGPTQGLVRGSEQILGRLLTLAQQLDPPSRDELKDLYLKLHNSARKQTSSGDSGRDSRGLTDAGSQPVELGEEDGEVHAAEQALEEVRSLAAKDPAAALARAEVIALPAYRSRALAAVAKKCRNAAQATQALRDAERAATQIEVPQGASPEELAKETARRVEALVEIAEGWAQWRDTEQASASLGSGFALTMDLIQKQEALRPEAPSGFGASINLLRRLAQAEVRLGPTQASERAQTISDPRLRAYFLVSMATAILGNI